VEVLTRVQLFGGIALKNLERQKTSKIWRDLEQLLSLSTNISEIEADIDKR